ncbi:MAG TPA: cbb3-type cytochrome oxidase assembly protein CcoS [Bacteroidetes bacterium]|nr:cbb3-type cytochrome oxidase assembly protein CcoS [Bacteroidota bacterium]
MRALPHSLPGVNVLYFLVPLAVLLAACGVAAFRWAVRDGQFDDTETPALRILLDDTDD